MTELPPPRPPVAPRPRLRRFYDSYQWWHWTLLAVGVVFLLIIFGPAYIAMIRWGMN